MAQLHSLCAAACQLHAPQRSAFLGLPSSSPAAAGLQRANSASGVRLPQLGARRHPAVTAKIREIFMPALSSTMTEGKIVSWSVSEGDTVSKGESVVVVESDKADMDVETFYDGILAAILVNEGEVAPVGAAIGILAESEEELEAAKAKAAGATSSTPTGNGSSTAAAAAEVPAAAPPPAAAPTPAVVAAVPAATAAAVVSTHPAAVGGRIVATPYAKKLAKDLNVDLKTVAGTGPLGRIVAADVESAAARLAAVAAVPPAAVTAPVPAAPAVAPAAAVAAAAVPEPARTSPPPGMAYTVVPFTPMQAAVARNMVASLAVPVSKVGYRITTDALDALYKKVKSKGVTMTALLAKAVAMALAQHPIMNAACGADSSSFAYNDRVNVAVAVAMDGGLITPVLTDADKTDLYTLSAQWKELVSKARGKKLSPSEYAGGTFTLSNLGMYGVDRFDAILPPGQGAIMAVGASRKVVLPLDNGMFAVRHQMQVNVTADHRIIYGADIAEFLQTLSKIIEEPSSLTH